MNIELLLEAERRGILPDDKAALLAEARKRGLVAQSTQTASEPEEKTFGQKIKENLLGDDDPTTQNFGEKVGTWLNKAGEAMTFGLVGDEASAAVESLVPGVDYSDRREHYRGQERVLERDNPGAALSADIGGSLLGAMLPLGTIGTVARGARLPARIGASTAAGTGIGGTYGFMEGEGGLSQRAREARKGALLGGSVGAVAPVVGAGVQKAADSAVARKAIKAAAKNAPTTEALKTLGDSQYKAVDAAGVRIRPDAFSRNRQQILHALRGSGLDELPGPSSLTPKSARVMQIAKAMDDEMAPIATGGKTSLPFAQLDQLRRHAGTAAQSADKTDASLGMGIISGLDDFVRKMRPNDVTSGDVKALKTMLPKARDTWARMSRSQLLDDAIEAEGNYMSGGASAIRNKFAAILRNPKLSAGFSDAEKVVMRKVVTGSIPKVLLDYMGSGLGMTAQAFGGALAGGLPGFVAGSATAAAARRGSEAITRNAAEVARAIVANGGLKQLPVASDSGRKVIEALLRRTGAVAPQ